MKVILQEDVKGQGKKGDLINVSDGYARNYLIPRKLAVAATTDAINAIKIREEAEKRRIAKEREEAEELARKLAEMPIRVKGNAGASGKLFGAITSKNISDSLNEQYGIEIDTRKIVIDEPIKSFGSYEIKVKLFPEISGTLYVHVTE
ncbi:MAG: 50S ribosomal protein L9 [Clostridiales bacterium]|jgi:large subunit ribosomal protein L9|nr:50S ribosomal protein L9 [Clostridiales bacterium]